MKSILLMCLVAGVSSSFAQGDQKKKDEAREGLQSAEVLIKQWIATEGLIEKEALQWKEKQAHFSRLLDLYQGRIKELDEELKAANWEQSDFASEVAQYKASIQSSEAARKEMIGFVAKVLPRVESIMQFFPEPLVQQLDPEIQLLEQEVDNKNVREVLRAVVRILQESERFNRNLTFHEQALQLEGAICHGKVLYIGLSCSIFKAGEKVGIGKPAVEQWACTLKPELKDQINKAFAIYEKQVPSSLFKLPMQIVEVKP